MEFVLSDENTVSSHGFRVLNSGGRFERFNNNPVMLHEHDTGKLIGRWSNLRTQGSQLLGTPEFDEGDSFAMEIKGKVDRGYLKGASLGIFPLSWSVENEDVCCSEWELYEVSTCSVPSNKSALRLYKKNGEEMRDEEIKLSIDSYKTEKTNRTKNMEKIQLSVEVAGILQLGVEPGARELNAAIIELNSKLKTSEEEVVELKTEKLTANKKRAEDLVKQAIKDGKITAENKDSFVKLATSDYAAAESILSGLGGRTYLSGMVNPSNPGKDKTDRANWTLSDWRTKDMVGLKKLSIEHPDEFKKLNEAHIEGLRK